MTNSPEGEGLVERLRAHGDAVSSARSAALLRQAADRIEALEAENGGLRDVLAETQLSEAELEAACRDLDLTIEELRDRLSDIGGG